MSVPNDLIRRETLHGEAVRAGNLTVMPQSQAIVLRWPGGGLVWNRPVGVLVARGGQQWRVPIVDVTRLAVAGLLGLSAVFIVMSITRGARIRRNEHG